ncbi:HD-GYP domain-containing protein (c-di-GMP phosphodiesterase class II) [Paenibacillus forsythiae]|uniref:HD-GYP domain-containing protein (C-di-GMP phosphodiesterase class II) n=1 Tax=Paenibacillus forsythiae TaxID=365616 RepID=A0ABU3H3W8_9BACL|nr:HD domain-containing phosphohydrolase [Paenibacillus forsythiae]MDT3425421.1 HD-GYP domain-containing protein (c-di-GMP phosphodiesterase class II) [Paenibacillus forsythiae]
MLKKLLTTGPLLMLAMFLFSSAVFASPVAGNLTSDQQEALKIILQHHERLDGSGYPYGIREEEILPEAKIIGIADTFDAMTSDRPYRKGLPPEVAMDELKRLSGIHYDGELVQLFEQALIADGVLRPEEK